ncbi:MAG: LPS export ABC transporter periplasmic protein LptC [Elusimicrobia bacterium RIFOXYA2_FULL_40_6]|nr:MAG: LPS export ABC transporter periplasmic protein LptC [Elusimicrobia bacterium RIFOXYA2_FULL_40_6]
MKKFGRIAVAALVFGFFGCSDKALTSKSQAGPEQVLKKFTAFESKNGIKNWTLIAQEAKIYESHKNAQLKDFLVNFFTDDGKQIKAVLKAQLGEIDTDKNDFYTKGPTTITSADNTVLQSTDLRYKSDTKKIYGDSYVKLIKSDGIVEGKGIEAEPDLSSVIIKESMAHATSEGSK